MSNYHKKTTDQNYRRRVPRKKRSVVPNKLVESLSINGAKYEGTYQFICGNVVPIYEVSTVHALNQIIGYAKFINQSYGNVYYRGECKLHSSLKPSLFRNCKITDKQTSRLMKNIQVISDDPKMQNTLKIKKNDFDIEKSKIEGMLQHYGVPTRLIDVVDNHWIALWMGLYNVKKSKQINQFYHYSKRSIPLVEFAKGASVSDELLFQYIMLIAVPFSEDRSFSGIQMSSDYIEVDLRQALPSVFLRPHAQHGLVVRRKVHEEEYGQGTDAYDIAPIVIGIIKIRIDRANEWLGEGQLLNQENLFPPPAYDFGYDLLLSREDLLANGNFSIAKYV